MLCTKYNVQQLGLKFLLNVNVNFIDDRFFCVKIKKQTPVKIRFIVPAGDQKASHAVLDKRMYRAYVRKKILLYS